MHMRSKFIFSVLTLSILSIVYSAIAADVDLLVKQKGDKKFYYLNIAASDFKAETDPPNEEFYKGTAFYFVMTAKENWELDEKFHEKTLPDIFFTQNEDTLKILNSKPFYGDKKDISKILISISKKLDTTKPFTVHINSGKQVESVEFLLPEDLWPGYPLLRKQFDEAVALNGADKKIEAFRKMSELLKSDKLPIFSFYQEAIDIRNSIFISNFQNVLDAFLKIRMDKELTVINRLDSLNVLVIRYGILIDSLVYDTTATPKIVEALNIQRNDAIKKRKELADYIVQINKEMDYAKVSWMAASGPEDHRFRLIVEALYNLMRKQNLDSLWNSEAKLPDSTIMKLDAFELSDAYAALKRMMTRSMKAGEPLFLPAIENNLKNRTGSMKEPYILNIFMVDSYYRGDLEAARNYLEEALKISSDMNLNDWLGSIQVNYFGTSESTPKNILEISREGLALLNTGDFEGALQIYQRGQIISPNSPLISYNIGNYNLLKADTLKAITFYELAFRQDANIPAVQRKLFQLYIDVGEWEKALVVIDTSLATVSTWENNYCYARCLMHTGNYTGAITALDSAAVLNPFNYDQYILLGDAYLKTGNKENARTIYDKARLMEPTRDLAYKRLEELDK